MRPDRGSRSTGRCDKGAVLALQKAMRKLLLPTLLLLPIVIPAQSVLPPFNTYYQAVDLGSMPSVHDYGGICFDPSDPNTLLVSAYGSGRIAAVQLVRDAAGRITGFGTTTTRATVGGNDGGLAVGPGNVLLFTWYGANRLGQVRPGSSVADRVDDLHPLGVATSVGTCAIVPSGRAGAGRCKLASYADSLWYDVTLTPDGHGTFAPTLSGSPVPIQGGPEGILYPPASSPLLGDRVLVCEWNAGITAYQTDANGDPLPSTRQLVLTGLGANGGGALDPITGDFLFTGGNGRLVAMRLGATCGTIGAYGQATPGATRTPTLTAVGCARLGQTFTMTVVGEPHAFGAFAMGTWPTNFQLAGVHVLTNMTVSISHQLDAQGRLVVPFAVPPTAAFGDLRLYFQAGYLSPGSATGFAATAGLEVWIR